ncbi:hypothetical protein PVIIG_06319 [Plasmodium vivax India VII]|uniref:VIR protein n=1 Tax=Plasmodium vivax India VII TaxID=1077284 RepID=A0A0J9V8R0_PLAVI|nr:hypothetical protein PVIIG_06319 [Plasmodium vivax India VII]
MAVPGSDDVYLTYDDYITFKEKFDKNDPFSSNTINLGQILDEADIKTPKDSKLYKIFVKLLKHINDDHYFYGDKQIDACRYIRYMLQKEVEDNLKKNYDSNFVEMFHNFLRKYGEKITHRKDRCISKIDPIESTRFNNMDALHRLYDKYRYYKDFSTSTAHYVCDTFHVFIKAYNSYINDNASKSEFFNKILENFSKNVTKKVSDFTLPCSHFRYDLSRPKLYKPTPVIKTESHSPTQEDQKEFSSGVAKSHGSSHETLDISHLQLHQEETVLPSIQIETTKLETLEENDDHREASDNYAMHYPRRETDAIIELPPRIQRPDVVFGSLRTQLQPQHPEYLNPQHLPNEAAGDSSTIIGSITSALKGVDPVPVVGVSVEEEDAYVEFLVVSMDNSQEDFQDMKIMKEGILDMVQ